MPFIPRLLLTLQVSTSILAQHECELGFGSWNFFCRCRFTASFCNHLIKTRWSTNYLNILKDALINKIVTMIPNQSEILAAF